MRRGVLDEKSTKQHEREGDGMWYHGKGPVVRRLGGVVLLALAVALAPGGTGASAGTEDPDIADVRTLPQDPALYLTGDPGEVLVPRETAERWRGSFDRAFFAPWDQRGPRGGRESLLWAFDYLASKDVYGENRRLRSGAWFDRQRKNSREEVFGTVNRRGMTVAETDLRAFPTEEPAFFSFERAGEGYPFDYLQNSRLKPGEPFFVSHVSLDGRWAFGDASFASGWVDVRHLAWVDDEAAASWRRGPFAVVWARDVPLRDLRGEFLAVATTGTLLPLEGCDVLSGLRVRVPRRGPDGRLEGVLVRLSFEEAAPFPLEFTGWNAARMASALAGEPYGWGGFLNRRDCSAMVRDFFAPFGLWLPRNSKAQGMSGVVREVGSLDRHAKEKILREEGRPWRTLVYLPGHIMLYVGSWRGRAVVFHNTWGIRTLSGDREGRHIVGGAVFSTLAPGLELPDLFPEKGIVANRVTSFVLLGE